MAVYEINPQDYNKKLAEALKQFPEFIAPDWSFFVKTGGNKERPPQETDFWHIRAASIMKQFYIRGVLGVSRLRTRYGGRKNRGMKPAEFRRASGKIIRLILQQAEKAGLLEKSDGKRKGRKLTKKGVKFMEDIS
jgi:small subunit ribosomal protein S19e